METPPVTERLDPKLWKMIAVVLLGPFMSQMDATIVNVSLSTIRHDLHATIESAQWIMSGYLLALALMLPLNGWLVARIGAKRLYLGCFTVFTLASLLCGAATTMDALVGARIVQGMAGGLLAPLTQLMLARAAGKQMARVMGYASMPILIAPTLGPILAGAILQHAGWPWLFYVNLPVGILAVVLAAVLLPSDQDSLQKRPFDFFGFLLISPGLVGVLYGLEQASQHHGVWLQLLGLTLLGTFIWHAKRQNAAALVDLSLFKISIFATATVTQFFANGILYGGQFLVPLFLTTGCGLTAAEAGWILAPMGLGMMCVYPLAGLLTDRFGCRCVVSFGIVVNVLGTLPFLWMAHYGYSAVLTVVCLFLRGAGQGATGIPTISAAYGAVAKDRLAYATTALNIVQRLGGPIATTSLAIVMALAATTFPAVGAGAFLIPFAALLLLQMVVFFSAQRLPARVHQT